MFKIEKNIPIKEVRKNNGPLPYHMMDVGDSVLMPTENGAPYEKQLIRVTAHRYAKQKNQKVVTRNEGTGVRVWRVA